MLRQLLIVALFVASAISSEIFRFGYDIEQFARYNKKDVQLTISVWLDEIASGSEYDIEPIAYDDPKKMASDLEAGKVDLVTTSSLNFVKYFDKATLADGFSGGDYDADGHRLLLVVKEDGPIRQWKGFERAKVLVLEGSDISELYLDLSLLHHGVFDHVEWIKTKNYQQALLKLFFGKADAAIVTQKALGFASEMNPQMRQRLKVFDQSTLTDVMPSYFRKTVSETMRKDITDAAMQVTSTVRGRQVMAIFRADSIIKIPLSTLLPVEEAYDTYLRSIKKEKQ